MDSQKIISIGSLNLGYIFAIKTNRLSIANTII